VNDTLGVGKINFILPNAILRPTCSLSFVEKVVKVNCQPANTTFLQPCSIQYFELQVVNWSIYYPRYDTIFYVPVVLEFTYSN
jgi:hypothetical protein